MMRSAVRSRLAPPASARFASFGSASRHKSILAKRAEAAAPEPKGRRRAGSEHVYILESLDSEHFYAGITDDVSARLTEHKAGEVPRTSKYRPWRVKTYVAFSDEKKAVAF